MVFLLVALEWFRTEMILSGPHRVSQYIVLLERLTYPDVHSVARSMRQAKEELVMSHDSKTFRRFIKICELLKTKTMTKKQIK
jgi:hypothetical protein